MPSSKSTSSLSPEDRARILARLRSLTRLTDDAIGIPGTKYRIGLDPLLGLIPGAGDAVGFGMSAYLLLEAQRLGVPRRTLTRMVWNSVLDALVGTVPVLGDLFDFAFKANRRNLKLLEKALNPEGGINSKPDTVQEIRQSANLEKTDRTRPPSN